jgi:hypothetical protein
MPEQNGAFGSELRDILRACETKAEVFRWLEMNRPCSMKWDLVPKMFNNLPDHHRNQSEPT